MDETVSTDKVTTLRSRKRLRPNAGMANCTAVGAAVDQPGVGSTAASVQRLIMRYYNNVRSQAIDGFDSAKRVALFGFVLLVLTITYVIVIDFMAHLNLPWFVQPPREGMNVGAIGLISAVVVEAIAGTQFVLYGRAARQFGAFHICLERTHRYLLAYKMAEQIKNDRDHTLEKIVCIMANAPMITRVDIEGVDSGALLPNLRQTATGTMVAGTPAAGDVLPTAAAS
jgi:hypothetical protein